MPVGENADAERRGYFGELLELMELLEYEHLDDGQKHVLFSHWAFACSDRYVDAYLEHERFMRAGNIKAAVHYIRKIKGLLPVLDCCGRLSRQLRKRRRHFLLGKHFRFAPTQEQRNGMLLCSWTKDDIEIMRKHGVSPAGGPFSKPKLMSFSDVEDLKSSARNSADALRASNKDWTPPEADTILVPGRYSAALRLVLVDVRRPLKETFDHLENLLAKERDAYFSAYPADRLAHERLKADGRLNPYDFDALKKRLLIFLMEEAGVDRDVTIERFFPKSHRHNASSQISVSLKDVRALIASVEAGRGLV